MEAVLVLLGLFVVYTLYRFQEMERGLTIVRDQVDSLTLTGSVRAASAPPFTAGAPPAPPRVVMSSPPVVGPPGPVDSSPASRAFDAPYLPPPSTPAPQSPAEAPGPVGSRIPWYLDSPQAAPDIPTPIISRLKPRAAAPAASAAMVSPPSSTMGDFESRVGGSWMARLGVIAIAFGMAFLLQYAFPLIGPAGRVGIGVAVGVALLGAGQALIRKPLYRLYAQALSSGGIIVLFLSIYAAHNLYHLIGYWIAFAALLIPALTASLLAVRNDTEAVAIFCVLGGFAVPVVLQSGQGAPDPSGLFRLYAYLGFLDLWVIGMVIAKRWNGLPIVALSATWVLFFTAGPLQGAGWTVEAFCVLFLALSTTMGLQILFTSARPSPTAGGGPELGVMLGEQINRTLEIGDLLGVWIVAVGAAAFALASSEILTKQSVSGWPAATLTGILLTLLFAVLSAAAPTPNAAKVEGKAAPATSPRSVFAYLSAASALLVMWPAAGTVGAIPRAALPAACGFGLGVYLLFLAVAVWMARGESRKGNGKGTGAGSGALLLGANALVHVAMVAIALKGVTFLGLPAIAAWLPVAGWLTLISLLVVNAGAGSRKNTVFAGVAAVCAQTLTAVGLCLAVWGSTGAKGPGASLFAGEFLLLSLTALGMRRLLIAGPFRGDLLTAYGNAALFFLLLTQTLGMSKVGGVTLLAAASAGFALYHGLVGATLMRLPNRDPNRDKLHELTYFGLAVTFAALAVPLQLRESHVTTMAWAVEAVALFWIGLTVREPRSRWYGAALLSLAAGKALLLDLQLDSVGTGRLPGSRLLACGSVVAACYLSAWMLGRRRDLLTKAEEPVLPGLAVTANVVTLLCGSVHLWDAARTIWPAGGISAPQLTLFIFWAVYALAVIGVGIWKRLREVRLLAMGLLYLSIVKVFLFDLAGLQQPYRIFSFLTLGVVLLLVSLLYTRFEAWLRETGFEGGEGSAPATA